MKLTQVTDKEFAKILNVGGPMLVSFQASWCRQSQALAPILEEVADDLGRQVQMVSVDMDDDTAGIRRRYNVTRVPVTMMIADGKMVDLIGGVTDKASIADMVKKRLGPVVDVDDTTFTREVLRSRVPTLVHFYAAWCDVSLSLQPIVEQVAKKFEGKAKVVQIPYGPESAQVRARYGVMRVPTVALFEGGELEDQILGGSKDGDNISKMVSSFVG
jgi:thioredoxin 1